MMRPSLSDMFGNETVAGDWSTTGTLSDDWSGVGVLNVAEAMLSAKYSNPVTVLGNLPMRDVSCEDDQLSFVQQLFEIADVFCDGSSGGIAFGEIVMKF